MRACRVSTRCCRTPGRATCRPRSCVVTRAWSEDEWAAGLESFAARGFVDGAGAFTDAGRAQRQQIEDATDRAALVAYEALSDDEAGEVVAIGRTLTERVVAAGLLQVDPSRFDDT